MPLQSPPAERKVLVGIGFGSGAEAVLRAAHEHALLTGSRLFAVSIDEPEIMSATERQSRAQALSLARQLGAEVILASGSHVGRSLLRVARELRVSLLVLGAPRFYQRLAFWRVDAPVLWLQTHAAGIRLLLVPRAESVAENINQFTEPEAEPTEHQWREYAGAILIAATGTGLGVLLEPTIGYWSVALIYLLIVTLTGVSFKRGPTLMLATLSALLWDLIFIPPRFSFYINQPQDAMMLAMFFAVALAVGHLTTRLRGRQRIEHRM